MTEDAPRLILRGNHVLALLNDSRSGIKRPPAGKVLSSFLNSAQASVVSIKTWQRWQYQSNFKTLENFTVKEQKEVESGLKETSVPFEWNC